MSLFDWKDIISTVATVTTVGQFLTGIQVCQKFVKAGTTENISGLPFVVGALNCGLWTKYGLYIRDGPVALVNGIGCFLMLSYTICYLLYTIKSKQVILQQIIGAASFFGTILIVTDVFTADELHGQYILGIIACCLAVGFFASPLVSLPHVVRTRSTEVLPFGMIVANFIAGALWGLYGLIIQDNFLKIPNFLGVCLSTFLLLLYVHFPSRPPIPRSSSSTEPLINRKDSTYLDM